MRWPTPEAKSLRYPIYRTSCRLNKTLTPKLEWRARSAEGETLPPPERAVQLTLLQPAHHSDTDPLRRAYRRKASSTRMTAQGSTTRTSSTGKRLTCVGAAGAAPPSPKQRALEALFVIPTIESTGGSCNSCPRGSESPCTQKHYSAPR